MTALGMIEIRGYLGAVTVADVALKTAAVELKKAEVIRGGLTTIQVIGDVAAVKTSVDAAIAVANELNVLISSCVIPRLDSQTEALLFPDEHAKVESKELLDEAELTEELSAPSSKTSVDNSTIEASTIIKVPETTFPKEKLSEMKVVELRKLAYQLNLKSMTKKEIKFAKKDPLIDVILSELEGSDFEWN